MAQPKIKKSAAGHSYAPRRKDTTEKSLMRLMGSAAGMPYMLMNKRINALLGRDQKSNVAVKDK